MSEVISNITKIPIHRGVDNTVLSRFALIDTIYAPTILPFRWLLFDPATPPYIGVLVGSYDHSSSIPQHKQRLKQKRVPLFLNRIIYALSRGHVIDPLNLLPTIDYVRQLQRLRFHSPDKFDCRLCNIDDRLSPRAIMDRQQRSEAGCLSPSSEATGIQHPYPQLLRPLTPLDTGLNPLSTTMPSPTTDLEDEALVKDVLDILGGPPDTSPVVSKQELRTEQEQQSQQPSPNQNLHEESDED